MYNEESEAKYFHVKITQKLETELDTIDNEKYINILTIVIMEQKNTKKINLKKIVYLKK